MRILRNLFTLLVLFALFTTVGCGGSTAPKATTGNQLSQFLEANPAIATEEEEEDEEDEVFEDE